MAKQQESKQLVVNSNTCVGSTFSHVVGVTVSDIEVTLEFVYIHPRSKEGQVVSRVTLPIDVASDLSRVISSSINNHGNSK